MFVSVAVGIFLVIFLAARGHLNPVLTNTTVISALAPFQRAISWAGDKVNGAVTTVWDIAAVYYQNNELHGIQLFQDGSLRHTHILLLQHLA